MARSNYKNGTFVPFRHSLSGGVSWYNKEESHQIKMRKESLNAGMSSAVSYDVTNRELSKQDSFIQLCEKHDVKPTKRQASKFRRKFGKAYKSWKE